MGRKRLCRNCQRIDGLHGIPCWSLPALHRLMENARLARQQFWMPGEGIAAKHDAALRPILRSSGVAKDGGFLRVKTWPEGIEHRAQCCNSTKNMAWLHRYLRLRLGWRNCSRFLLHGG